MLANIITFHIRYIKTTFMAHLKLMIFSSIFELLKFLCQMARFAIFLLHGLHTKRVYNKNQVWSLDSEVSPPTRAKQKFFFFVEKLLNFGHMGRYFIKTIYMKNVGKVTSFNMRGLQYDGHYETIVDETTGSYIW